jgi:hypothetical protein
VTSHAPLLKLPSSEQQTAQSRQSHEETKRTQPIKIKDGPITSSKAPGTAKPVTPRTPSPAPATVCQAKLSKDAGGTTHPEDRCRCGQLFLSEQEWKAHEAACENTASPTDDNDDPPMRYFFAAPQYPLPSDNSSTEPLCLRSTKLKPRRERWMRPSLLRSPTPTLSGTASAVLLPHIFQASPTLPNSAILYTICNQHRPERRFGIVCPYR